MALFSSNNPKEKQNPGILGVFSVDVIKWEPETDIEASVIAHKFEYEDFPSGSYLIVGPSQMAIFTNNTNYTKSSESSTTPSQVTTFVGPCKIKLETGDIRFAPFRNIAHALTGGESAFHSTVYFINTTYLNDLAWGTQAPVIVEDPEEGVNVHVRAFGMFGAHIEHTDIEQAPQQAMNFLTKVVGTRADFTRDDLLKFMRAKILEFVPNLLANNIIKQNISILKISAYLSDFSAIVHRSLQEHFKTFGLTLDNFSFHSINVPEEDLRIINEAKIQRKKNQIEAEGVASRMDTESAARARMREREGYTYQQEKSFEVMQAAAQNEGVSSNLMGAGMGLGMGFGIGDAMGASMNNIAKNTMLASAPASTKTCTNCGTSIDNNAKFCPNCGEKASTGQAFCPECGKEISANAKFCMNCGHKLQNKCFNCGTTIAPGTKFCPECGTPV